MLYLQKILRFYTIISLFILTSGCSQNLSRGDAAGLISKASDFQGVRSSMYLHGQWQKQALDEGEIVLNGGVLCWVVVTDPRLLALLSSTDCIPAGVHLRKPVITPSIDVTGMTDATDSGKAKVVQFDWKYQSESVPGPLNRFVIGGGTGVAVLQLYDDGWRVESVKTSVGDAPYVLSAAEEQEAQQQMAVRREEVSREAERAREAAERVRAEQERASAELRAEQERASAEQEAIRQKLPTAWAYVNIPPYEKTTLITQPFGYSVAVQGGILHTVYQDGTDCVYSRSPCPAGAIRGIYIENGEVEKKQISVRYRFVPIGQ